MTKGESFCGQYRSFSGCGSYGKILTIENYRVYYFIETGYINI